MHLPSLIGIPATSVLGEKCYQVLVEDLNITNVPCIKLAVSKALGLAIVAGGSFVKVPQIYKVFSARSVKGLSTTAYFLELAAYTVALVYNLRMGNPFSTFGETAFLTVQDLVIMLALFYFRSQTAYAWLFLAAFFLVFQYLRSASLVPIELLAFFQVCAIPLTLASRLPQIYQNYCNRSTGQLAAFTIFMYFFGSSARIFTTLQEVNDNIILWGFILAATLNSILAGQMVYYWCADEKDSHLALDNRSKLA